MFIPMYYDNMTAVRQPALIELDKLSSEPGKPYGIITADCSGAHEFDDGLLVTRVPDTADERYNVKVFAVDTSVLYRDQAITDRVLSLTESRYHDPNTLTQTYAPMLDAELTQRLHFIQGTMRSALVVSFDVGPQLPPTTPEISFGRVEVRHNYTYSRFSRHMQPGGNSWRYGRAAELLMGHLGDPSSESFEGEQTPEKALNGGHWHNGSLKNQAFMVAANHLVGRLMRDEGRLAIYRAHDVAGDHLHDVLDPRIARYTTQPLPHHGLGLDVYCRITSPLRRGEDFVMHGLLKARNRDKQLDGNDRKLVTEMVRRLNWRIIRQVNEGTYRPDNDDSLSDDRAVAS